MIVILISTEPGLEHNNGIHHRVCVPGISSGKHVLQGVWLHQHDASHHFLARLQARSLHEDPSQNHVHGTGLHTLLLHIKQSMCLCTS